MNRTTQFMVCITLILSHNAFSFSQRFYPAKGLDLSYVFSANYKPESFFGKNINLLNDQVGADVTWFSRHIIDLYIDVIAGKDTFGYPIVEFAFAARNKGVWGDPESIARTTVSGIKELEVVSGYHKHSIPRHIFWMREGWLQFAIPDLFKLSFGHEHVFKIGFFPFQLGRGISLGAAYAVGPETLGFYSNSVIDQYAPGALFSGELITGRLEYDLYGAILDNKMASFGQTAAKILGQQVGKKHCQERGAGKINYLFAGDVNWVIKEDEIFGQLVCQPYWLFNNDPEQRVEFKADASSKLSTLGVMFDFVGDRFAWGLETAFNLGRQKVKAWDRNTIKKENRGGQVLIVNSHVVDQNGDKIVYVPGSDAQKIIDRDLLDCIECVECENDKKIGELANGVGIMPGPLDLINSPNRYRNAFTNTYKGWMVVGDISWWVIPSFLQLSFEAGIASGDEHPCSESVDADFEGFIGLQEIYSGRAVRSAFVLGGAGRMPRPLSSPSSSQAPSKFAKSVNGFTNLIYGGIGVQWYPQRFDARWQINPNILAFAQQQATNKFDCKTKKDVIDENGCPVKARRYLGTELNIFSYYAFYENFKIYLVSSLFIPGGHFTDIKGKPLTSHQAKVLDKWDRTGITGDKIPNIGDNVAFTFNLGLNFNF